MTVMICKLVHQKLVTDARQDALIAAVLEHLTMLEQREGHLQKLVCRSLFSVDVSGCERRK